MTTTMNNIKGLNNDKNKNMELNGKMKFIYKLHNGMVLSEVLKKITKDKSFKFIMSADLNTYLFKNKNDDTIFIDNTGSLIQSSIEVPSEFESISQKRLSRTQNMIEALWT